MTLPRSNKEIFWWTRENKNKEVSRCYSGFDHISLGGHDKFRVEMYNVFIDSFCLQLEKRIETYNVLFITELHVNLPQDTDEEEISMNLDNCILSYKKDVDNTIKNEIIQFKKYWALSKPSYNDTKDMLNNLSNEKM